MPPPSGHKDGLPRFLQSNGPDPDARIYVQIKGLKVSHMLQTYEELANGLGSGNSLKDSRKPGYPTASNNRHNKHANQAYRTGPTSAHMGTVRPEARK